MSKNTGITLVDVRDEAMEAIQKIKSKELNLKEAQAIKGFLDVIVNTAKAQVGYLHAIPKSVKEKMSSIEIKAMAGTLTDRDAELDQSLVQIKESSNHYERS